uniref:Uncharacterized protein n=2 Tax=Babesia bovis TaxID=5865 RepID=A7AS28_BABBO|eukprot:XP_001610915.1 hypothetical protein [Babesia bovis T2Bo]
MSALDVIDIFSLQTSEELRDKLISKYCFSVKIHDRKLSHGALELQHSHVDGSTSRLSDVVASLEHDGLFKVENPVSQIPSDNIQTSDADEADDISIADMIDRLDQLSATLWETCDNIQGKSRRKLRNLCTTLSAVNSVSMPLNIDDIASRLKDIDLVADSVCRKKEQFNYLMLLDYLQSILQLNLDAVTLLHNWDDTFRNIKSLFQSYHDYREAGGTGVKLLTSTDIEVRFTLEKACELRRILLQLSHARGLSVGNNKDFIKIASTLDTVFNNYTEFLEDISTDVVMHYYNTADSLPEDVKDPFHQLCDLSVDMCSTDDNNVILRTLVRCVSNILHNKFSLLLDEYSMSLKLDSGSSILEEDVLSLENAIALTTANYVDAIGKYIMEKNDLLKHHLAMLHSRKMLNSDITLKNIYMQLLKKAFNNFEVYNGLLKPLPSYIFLNIATTALTSLECSLEDMMAMLSDIVTVDEIQSQMMVPHKLLLRYILVLDESSKNQCWKASVSVDDTVDSYLTGLDSYIAYMGSIRTNERGIISVNNDINVAGPFQWVYNRLLLWHLREAYATLMSSMSESVNSYCMSQSLTKISRDLSIAMESQYSRILSRVVSSRTPLEKAVNHSVLPSCQYTDSTTLLSTNIKAVLTSDTSGIYNDLPDHIQQCLKEPLDGQTFTAFFYDTGDVANMIEKHIVRLISRKASLLISPYYETFATEVDGEVSSVILMICEYFTSLLPLFNRTEILSYNILGKSFTSFFDEELSRLSDLRPSDISALRRYKADLSQLLLISRCCKSEVAESIEEMIAACGDRS